MQTNRKIFYVYIYVDENKVPVYVGKGCWDRVDKHIAIVRKKIARNQKMGTHFYNFLAKMLNQGIEPDRFVSQNNLTEDEAHKLEIYLIKLFGRRDLKTGSLLNHTNGGEGSSGLKWSEESRANKRGDKHPYHNKGYLVSGEKNGFYGKKHTDAWKKHRKATIGAILKKSEKRKEFYKRLKLLNTGKKLSEETKMKISKSRKEFNKRKREQAQSSDSN